MLQYNSTIGVWGTTIICALITLIIIVLFILKKIDAVSALIYAWSTQTYTLLLIGPTFNSFLFVQFFLIFFYISKKSQIFIDKRYLLLLILPLLSSLFMYFYNTFINDFFYYNERSKALFYIRPLYFYIKTFGPLFLTGYIILKDRESNFENYEKTVLNIAKWSCIIAISQLLINQTFKDLDINELIGLKRRYIKVNDTGLLALRVQAFMPEPKDLACFMCLAIPIILNHKKYILFTFSIIVSLLTQSQTFIVLSFICIIIFSLPNRLQSVRKYILITTSIIIGLFQIVSLSKNYVIEHYQDFKDYEIVELIAKRAISRYTDYNNVLDEDEIEFIGMPIQKDQEMPIVKFFNDYPFLWFTGIGPGNTMFIDPLYFEGTTFHRDKINGEVAPTITMRWFNYIVHFGFIIASFFFLRLTDIKSIVSFRNKYYAFLWSCLFFAIIDIWVIIFYCLLIKENNNINKTYG